MIRHVILAALEHQQNAQEWMGSMASAGADPPKGPWFTQIHLCRNRKK